MPGNSNDDPKQQAQNLDLRVAISDAYAAVEGQKAIQSFSALTFEELANTQILRISGPDTPERPNDLNRVQQILNTVTASVAKIKALPASAFASQDPSRDVNTPTTP